MSEPTTFTTTIYPALERARALSRSITRCPDDADELWSITAEKAYRHRATFDANKGTAAAWVSTIMRRCACSMWTSTYATAVSQVEPSAIDGARRWAHEAELEQDLDDKRERADQRAKLHAAMSKLDGFRLSTARAMLRGDSPRMIAADEGITTGTVGSRVSRTMDALRSQLAA